MRALVVRETRGAREEDRGRILELPIGVEGVVREYLNDPRNGLLAVLAVDDGDLAGEVLLVPDSDLTLVVVDETSPFLDPSNPGGMVAPVSRG